MDILNTLTGKITGWIDQLFGIFGVYSQSYSKLIMYGVLLFILSKVLKSKVNVNVGGGK